MVLTLSERHELENQMGQLMKLRYADVGTVTDPHALELREILGKVRTKVRREAALRTTGTLSAYGSYLQRRVSCS